MNKTELKDALVILLNDHVCLDRENCDTECSACMADHLMANGVTVQRWIPVTERKPTAADADAKGNVLAYSKEGTANAHGWWFVSTSPTIFTHWMPLPQAPGKEGG